MSNRFQILSLDGGGIKGLFSAAVLAALEDDLKTSITSHFDLIAGTSTGGIIAIGLGLGMTPREIVDFYVSHGPNIFYPGSFSELRHFLTAKYEQDHLAAGLRECYGDRCLGHSEKRLVIPSYNIEAQDTYLFKTSHHERLTRDYKVPAWQVALATSAAPSYLPVCRHIGSVRLIDGGVWANNPILVAVTEAIGYLDVSLRDIAVFSIGTSSEVCPHPDKLDTGGLIAWRKAALEAALCGQSRGALDQAGLLIGKGNILRLNPSVPEGKFRLDKLNADELLGLASDHSRQVAPAFRAAFMSHTASPFEPCHRLEEEAFAC